MWGLDDVAALGAPANVMLVEVREHYLQKVLEMCYAVLMVDVVQEAIVMASDHVGEVDLLPFGEGLH